MILIVGFFTKYTWANPLRDKQVKTFLNGFIKIVNECKRKPNKLWIDQRR